MRRIRMVVPILAAGVWIFAAERLLAQPKADPGAIKAADSWLALVDAGQYAESWNQSASLFRDKISAPQWEEALKSARGPLGQLRTRTFVRAQFTRTAPGAPDGEYVVIRYETVFEKKESAVETITPMKDNDGVWRVAGYYIQ